MPATNWVYLAIFLNFLLTESRDAFRMWRGARYTHVIARTTTRRSALARTTIRPSALARTTTRPRALARATAGRVHSVQEERAVSQSNKLLLPKIITYLWPCTVLTSFREATFCGVPSCIFGKLRSAAGKKGLRNTGIHDVHRMRAYRLTAHIRMFNLKTAGSSCLKFFITSCQWRLIGTLAFCFMQQ
jgi:hypothetical protein